MTLNHRRRVRKWTRAEKITRCVPRVRSLINHSSENETTDGSSSASSDTHSRRDEATDLFLLYLRLDCTVGFAFCTFLSVQIIDCSRCNSERFDCRRCKCAWIVDGFQSTIVKNRRSIDPYVNLGFDTNLSSTFDILDVLPSSNMFFSAFLE